MIKEAFIESLSHLLNEDQKKLQLWQEVEVNYSKRGRYYHNLVHLESLLQELAPFKNRFANWDVVVFAIAYHDIIYNIVKSDNEEKSGAYAVKKLTEISCPKELASHCESLILATKKHEWADEQTNLFTDADLSILGTPSSIYQNYAQQIRNEYKVYPDLLYNPGRKKVLLHFLGMEKIFKTQQFFDKYERQARLNLNEELMHY